MLNSESIVIIRIKGEHLLYSKISDGKVYHIANIPRGDVYYIVSISREGLLCGRFTIRHRNAMQKRIHFRTDMEHNICRPVNNSDVSLGYQFCKSITFILYIIYNVRYNNI